MVGPVFRHDIFMMSKKRLDTKEKEIFNVDYEER